MIKAQISNKRTRFKLEQIVELVLQNAKRRAENAFEKLVVFFKKTGLIFYSSSQGTLHLNVDHVSE